MKICLDQVQIRDNTYMNNNNMLEIHSHEWMKSSREHRAHVVRVRHPQKVQTTSKENKYFIGLYYPINGSVCSFIQAHRTIE